MQYNSSAPTVVVQQPGVTINNTTVVVNQQPAGWSSGLCSCGEDLTSCCCALWCPNCYYACLAVRMGESCLVGFGSVPGGHLAMRAAFRNRHGIAGSIVNDCFTLQMCFPCAMCQLAREMDHKNYPPIGCCC